MTSTLLVLLLLSQAEGPDNPPDMAMEPPLWASSAGRLHYLARMEATGFALLPGGGTGGVERYVQLTPMLVLDGGEELGVNLGAPVRLRLGGGERGIGWVRREDWDSLSDWGQWVRALKLGSDAYPVGLWAGALDSYSLLSGHLVPAVFESRQSGLPPGWSLSHRHAGAPLRGGVFLGRAGRAPHGR
jgi:hypothetical protein